MIHPFNYPITRIARDGAVVSVGEIEGRAYIEPMPAYLRGDWGNRQHWRIASIDLDGTVPNPEPDDGPLGKPYHRTLSVTHTLDRDDPLFRDISLWLKGAKRKEIDGEWAAHVEELEAEGV